MGDLGLSETLDAVDATELIDRLQSYRPTGRQGYSLTALWRAYLSGFVMGLPSTNALIRHLQDDPVLRAICGFSKLPHRTTFNRFITRLGHHRDLVEDCMAVLTARLRDLLPGLGEKVAVDSTTVRSHSNPHRRNRKTGQVSDPEASWAAKNSAGGKNHKEWSWGYKFHLMADATYGIPLFGYTTTGSRHDSPELPSAECRDDPATPGIDAVDEDGWTAIAGATSAVYAPKPADVGRCLRATAMYTDNVRNPDRKDDQATGVLEVPVGQHGSFDTAPASDGGFVNAPPVFPDQDYTTEGDQSDSTIREVPENSEAGRSIGAPVSAHDEDDDLLIYILSGPDAQFFRIGRNDGQLKTEAPLNFEVRNSYSVV